MQDWLQGLLTVGLTAGWIVAVILGLRLLLKKAPRWITVCLWALLALRLMCPVSLESPVGLVPSAQVERAVETVLTVEPAPVTDVPPATPSLTEPTRPTLTAPTSSVVEEDTAATPFPWTAVLFGVWTTGVGGMLLYAVISTARLRLRMRDAVRLSGRIYQSDRTASPFVLGVFRPRIYLPYGLSAEERVSVQAHEETHIRRGDHLWKPLGFVLLSVYWFQPLLWVAYICLCRDIEAACDERVVRTLSPDERKRYSYALLAVGQERRRLTACPVAFGETGLKERVKRVKAYKKPAVWIVAVAVLLAAVAAVCLLTDRATEPPSRGSFEGATLRVTSEPKQTAVLDGMEVTVGEYRMMEDGGDELLMFRINEVNVEEMTVTVGFSKPLWVDGVKAESVTIPYDQTTVTLCSDEGAGEDRYVYTLRLTMPSSATHQWTSSLVLDADWVDRQINRTVYRSDEWTLSLYTDMGTFAVDFGRLSEHTMRGTYQEQDDRLILTEDAGVTEYVFEKGDGGQLRYNEEASYRHKHSRAVAPDDGFCLDHTFGYRMTAINDRKSPSRYRVEITDHDGRTVLEDDGFSGGAEAEVLSDKILRVTGYYEEGAMQERRHIYVDLTTMTTLSTCNRVISDTGFRATAYLEETEDGKHYVRVVQYDAEDDRCGTEHDRPISTAFRLYSVGDITSADVRVWLEEYRLTVAYTNKVGDNVVTVYNWHTGDRAESTVHAVGGSLTADANAAVETVFTQGDRRLHYSGISRAFYHLGNGQYVDLLTALKDGTLTLDALAAELGEDFESGALAVTGMDRNGTRYGSYDEKDSSQGVTLRALSNKDIYIGDTLAAVDHDTIEPLEFAAVCS